MSEINTIRIIIDSLLFMLILLVQLIIYPAFHNINVEVFSEWHHSYMQKISIIVGPLMLIQPVIVISQCLTQNTFLCYLSIIMILIVWIVTFIYSVPCHNLLQQEGYDKVIVDKLIITNWFRTIPWMICLFLGYLTSLRS